MQWLAVAVGGALGSLLRYGAALYIAPLWVGKFPLATFVVNMLGSFLIGLAYVLLQNTQAGEWRLFFMTGVLGGFTTFSAFSLELLHLWQQEHLALLLAYAAGSVCLGLLCAYMGMAFAQKLF